MSAASIIAFAMLGSIQDPAMDFDQARTFVRAGETSSLGLASPIAAVVFDHDMLLKYSVISFHLRWLPDEQPNRQPVWSARLRSTHHVNVVVRYADGRTCSALNEVLRAMEQLTAPEVDLPWVPPQIPPAELNGDEPMHDFTFRLSAPGNYSQNMTAARMTFSGGSLSPVGVWTRQAEAKLADCWSADPPAWVLEDEQTRARHAARIAGGWH